MLVLCPVAFPAVEQFRRLDAGIVAEEGDGLYLGAVQAFPEEVLIGEPGELRVGAQQLLGCEVRDIKPSEQLRQGSCEPECVRLPGDPAFDTQVFTEPAFAPHELPDQAFAAGQVGIALDIECAIGKDLSGADQFPDFLKLLRRVCSEHFQECGLTGKEAVLGVFLKQLQLIAIGAACLMIRFLHGPEPGQVDMRLSENYHPGCCGPVMAGKSIPEHVPGGGKGCCALRFRELEIGRVCKAHERVMDLHGTETALGQDFGKPHEGFHIQEQLIGCLMEDGSTAGTDRALGSRAGRDRFLFRRARAEVFQACSVPGIAFNEDLKGFPALAGAGERDIGVLSVNGADIAAVDIDQLFSAETGYKDDPLAPDLGRQGEARAEPAIGPAGAPCGAGRVRMHGCVQRLLRGQAVQGFKPFKGSR